MTRPTHTTDAQVRPRSPAVPFAGELRLRHRSRVAGVTALGLLLTGLILGCGRTLPYQPGASPAAMIPPDGGTEPLWLVVQPEGDGGEACPEPRPVAEAFTHLHPNASFPRLEPVDATLALECSGLSGDFVIARLGKQGDAWLGAHGCRQFPSGWPFGETFAGLARVQPTAALLSLQNIFCPGVADAGRAEFKGSDRMSAVAGFSSRAAADAWLANHPFD